MKVKTIFPCVCIDHTPTAADSGTYGMPVMQLYSCGDGRAYHFIPKCPNCGRGGLREFTSDYMALKEWNSMQFDLWDKAVTDFWTGEIIPGCEQWRIDLYLQMKERMAEL